MSKLNDAVQLREQIPEVAPNSTMPDNCDTKNITSLTWEEADEQTPA